MALPCTFLPNSSTDQVTSVTMLKEIMMQLRATQTHHHMKLRPFVSSDLSCCTDVFVRQDDVRWNLEQPYHCPHNIIKCGAKIFTVDVHGKQEVILMDRLKPARIEDPVTIDVRATDDTLLSPPPAVPTPQPTTRTTRSRRHVHWPD